RAVGDSKTALIFLVMAALLNVGLDLLFILVLKSGVAGAAYATILSQGLSAVACVIFTFKKYPVLRFNRRHLKPHGATMQKELWLGLPMGLQLSILSIGLLFVQAALNTLGTPYMAAFTASGRIDALSTQVFAAVGSALAVYVGQNYGAARLDRISAGVKAAVIMSAAVSVFLGGLQILLGRSITMLVVGAGKEQLYDLSQTFLTINASLYFSLVLLVLFRNALQGMNRSPLTLIGGAIELGSRTAFSILFMHVLEGDSRYIGICFCAGITWVITAIFLTIAYLIVIRKLKRSAASAPPPHDGEPSPTQITVA
ncbi:MAG: MATE family efflux transporter, partial [Clostridiales bacterium]|nr:MATE family efflux transporter [Clostridiales bacterium]